MLLTALCCPLLLTNIYFSATNISHHNMSGQRSTGSCGHKPAYDIRLKMTKAIWGCNLNVLLTILRIWWPNNPSMSEGILRMLLMYVHITHNIYIHLYIFYLSTHNYRHNWFSWFSPWKILPYDISCWIYQCIVSILLKTCSLKQPHQQPRLTTTTANWHFILQLIST